MKIKFYPPILLFLLACLVLVFSNSCGKDDPADPLSGNCTNAKTTAVFSPAVIYGSMTDQDGNTYRTVNIGTQTWMAENLRTTKYRDGSDIPLVSVNTEWTALTSGGHCNYENTSNCDTIATFGRLYNWYAATDPRNIAPVGWHVPTRAEYYTLQQYLASIGQSEGALKETGTSHWKSPNTGGTNLSGFTSLPGGVRLLSGTFADMGTDGNWWSTSITLGYIESLHLYSNSSSAPGGSYHQNCGLQIRCVKD